MKRYIALFILAAILSNACFSHSNHYNYDNPLIIQENTLLLLPLTQDLYPTDSDGKLKLTNDLFLPILLLTLLITFTFHRTILIIRRLIVLTPVFFQSNYVIHSPYEE